MKLGNPIRVAEGVFQIRAIGARVTALAEGDEVILVDAGMKGSSGLIIDSLEAIGLSIDMVKALVISHRHPDHAAGAAELIAGRDIPVMAHRLEAGVLTGREQAPVPVQSNLVTRITAQVIERMSGAPTRVDVELEDGDVIPFAFPVQVAHLPGHTAGSIGLFLPDRKLVIIGDALQYKLSLKLFPPAPGVTEDPEQAMESLRKLLNLDFDTICFSHFSPMRSGARAALSSMIEQRSLI